MRIDGEVSPAQRHEAVARFQAAPTRGSPSARVALLSLHAAGVGLTLTAASVGATTTAPCCGVPCCALPYELMCVAVACTLVKQQGQVRGKYKNYRLPFTAAAFP